MPIMLGQQSMNNFYRSVEFDNPTLAAQIHVDVGVVKLHAIGADKSKGRAAADHLRRVALDLPVIQQRVLESALQELGY